MKVFTIASKAPAPAFVLLSSWFMMVSDWFLTGLSWFLTGFLTAQGGHYEFKDQSGGSTAMSTLIIDRIEKIIESIESNSLDRMHLELTPN